MRRHGSQSIANETKRPPAGNAAVSIRAWVVAGLLILAGCTPTPPVDTAMMPMSSGIAGPANSIQYAGWAFALSSRLRNDPASAARAVAAVDYLGGALNTYPQWQDDNPLVSHEMLQARQDVRRALGILPATPSQVVVDRMIGAYLALTHNDRAAALKWLTTPYFTLGPERTLAVLTNMPFMRPVNIATSQALNALTGICVGGCYSGL